MANISMYCQKDKVYFHNPNRDNMKTPITVKDEAEWTD